MKKKLSEYFYEYEFKCECCGICNVSVKLLGMLDVARKIYGQPINPTSGCRCPQHNKEVGGLPDSAHITTNSEPCEAADLACGNSRFRYEMITALLSAGFTRIGINAKRNFLHVDIDSDKPQELIWIYD